MIALLQVVIISATKRTFIMLLLHYQSIIS